MAIEYITTNNELTSMADAIRNKFSLSEEVTFPDEYIDNINSVRNYDIKGYLEGTWSTFSDDSITTIPSYAFYSYSSLREVSFPNCTVINNYAFSSCSNLTTANFPNCSFVYMGAFYNCTSLNLVSIPKCINIRTTAFYSCSKLSTISCPNCVTLLERAFMGCYSLTDVYMPLITVVNSSAFAQCSRLTSIDFPNCTSISYGGFVQCYSLSTASIPSCLYIGQNAFSSCYLLSHVYAPVCININVGAFMYCRNLVSLNLTSVSRVTTLMNNSVFYSTPIDGFSGSTTEYGKVYVPTSLYDSFISATNWTYYNDHIFPVGANLYSTSAVYLSSSLSIPSYMESFSTSSFSFTNSIGSVFNSFRISSYSQVYYDNYLVYDGYWNDDTGQEITFQTDSSNAYPPEFVKWFYSNQSTSGGG